MPINAEISINNGIIDSIKQIESGVKLIIDGKAETYPEAFLYPGFCDSHGHVAGLGISKSIADLNRFKSQEQCALFLSENPSYRGNWIYARGWNHELWDNNQFPDKKILDLYFPDTPCCLIRVDGHSVWVNSKTLELCGIDSSSQNPEGGIIQKDDAGNPTGILIDNAMDMVLSKLPRYSSDEMKKMILNACNLLKQSGITTVHDMDTDLGLIELYRELDEAGNLPIRIFSYLKAQNDEWKSYNIKPFRGKNFSVCGLKFYADGALGSRGAALLEAYSDDTANSGLMLMDNETLFQKAKFGLENGFHIAVHAIGDLAVRSVIDVFERLRKDGFNSEDNILRIEHAQIVHPDDIRRIAQNRIICSVQPVHCISDYKMAIERTGERVSYSYPWKSLLNNNIRVLGGSDFPIESFSPFTGIYAFTKRIPFVGDSPWFEKECLSLEEAIEAYSETPEKIMKDTSHRSGFELVNRANLIITNQKLSEIDSSNYLNFEVLRVILA